MTSRTEVLHALALLAQAGEPLPEGLERLGVSDQTLRPWATRIATPLRQGVPLLTVLVTLRLVPKRLATQVEPLPLPIALAVLAEGLLAPVRGEWIVRYGFVVFFVVASLAPLLAIMVLIGLGISPLDILAPLEMRLASELILMNRHPFLALGCLALAVALMIASPLPRNTLQLLTSVAAPWAGKRLLMSTIIPSDAPVRQRFLSWLAHGSRHPGKAPWWPDWCLWWQQVRPPHPKEGPDVGTTPEPASLEQAGLWPAPWTPETWLMAMRQQHVALGRAVARPAQAIRTLLPMVAILGIGHGVFYPAFKSLGLISGLSYRGTGQELDAQLMAHAMTFWFGSSAIIAGIALAVIAGFASAPSTWIRRWWPMSLEQEGDVLALMAVGSDRSATMHSLSPGLRVRILALITTSTTEPRWIALCLHRWLRADLALLVMTAQRLPAATLSTLAARFRTVMAPTSFLSSSGLHLGALAVLCTGASWFLSYFLWPMFIQIARELEIPTEAMPWPVRWPWTNVLMSCVLLTATLIISLWHQHRWRSSGMRLLRAHLVAEACRERWDETAIVQALNPATTGPASWPQVMGALHLPAVTPDSLPRLIDNLTRQRERRARALHQLAALLTPLAFGLLVGINCWAIWRMVTGLLLTISGEIDGP